MLLLHICANGRSLLCPSVEYSQSLCMVVAGRCIQAPFSPCALTSALGKRVKQCSASQLNHNICCQSVNTSRLMSQPAPSPDLHSLESGATACSLPPTTEVRVSGQVKVHDWQDIPQREAAVNELQGFCMASINRLKLDTFQPLKLKGAVAEWPAVDKWSLDWLVQQYGEQRVQVRAAPSMRFAYVEPRLMPMYLKFRTPQQAPSMLTPMTLKQFALRAQRDSPDAPLFYPDGEFYYMQSPVTRDMRLSGDLNFDQSPFSAVLIHDEKGVRHIIPAAAARLWISPQGAVSPLHFDCHDSFLIQIRGIKRMLLWSTDQLHRMYPYRNWHILRRRGQVDPVKPNLKKFPKFADAHAVEVVLHPGDVLFFPGYWAHYTESCTHSVSMTCRFGLAQEVTKRRSIFSLLARP